MNIIPLLPDDESLLQQAAQLMVDVFREHWPDAWPTFEEGLKEVYEMLDPSRKHRSESPAAGPTLHRPPAELAA